MVCVVTLSMKSAVMGDQDELALPCPQLLSQPANRYDVKVVCGLIKEEQVRLRYKHLREVQAYLKSPERLWGDSSSSSSREAEAREHLLDLVGLVNVLFVRA